MKRLLTAVFVMTMYCQSVLAGDLVYVPKWHMTGNEACYAFDDAKKLVALDAQIVSDKDSITTLQKVSDDTKAAADIKQQQIDAQAKENARLSAALIQSIKDKNTAEGKIGGTPTQWIVIGVAGALILGVLADAYIIHMKGP